MGFFEAGIGSDTVSDFTTIAMKSTLSKITYAFCKDNNVPVDDVNDSDVKLPIFTSENGARKGILLVPKDILRHLPLTENWTDIWDAVQFNQELREKLSIFLAGIAKPTITQQKDAVRKAALQSSETFEGFLSVIRQKITSYDKNEDVFAYYKMRDILHNHMGLSSPETYDVSMGPPEIYRAVMSSINLFKHHVECGNLWEALWTSDGKPKRERAAQLIFYAIADAHCRASNISIAAEPNFGGGPVDFCFSHGFNCRVTVEMKKSSGTVVHGYSKQLNAYKKAASTDYGVYVVIDYGDLGNKLVKIEKSRQDELDRGNRPSDIIVIDATRKSSPSKIK